jgi:ribosome-binding factor A
MDISRAQRIGDQIRKTLGQILLQEVKDPRIKMLNLTDVEVSRDLSHAKVFYSLVDSEHTAAEVDIALQKAAGFMRVRIADELALRITPKLRFIYDASMDHGRQMSELINAAIADDEKKSKVTDAEDEKKSNTTDGE